MPFEKDLLSEVRLLERSYARGEISWEELIARKRDLYYEKSRIPKRESLLSKNEPKIDLRDKRNGIVLLFILALIVVSTYLFISDSILPINLASIIFS